MTFIAFRDYLRSHNKEREEYARIKKEAVKHANGEGKKYREYKNKFLEEVTKKAMKESNINVQIKKNKNLSKKEKQIINNARAKEWGEGEKKDFSKDYEPDTEWFFVKDNGKVVALGGLRPMVVNYMSKKYNIMGICSIISLIKGKGYWKILISFMKSYSYESGKTILGFTTQTEFFRKAELNTEKDFIKRFIYVKPNGEKVYDNEGDGIYYEGKDKFVSKILKTKSLVFIKVLHW